MNTLIEITFKKYGQVGTINVEWVTVLSHGGCVILVYNNIIMNTTIDSEWRWSVSL
jgi:hypothetical protein